jgi:hypothetical protein
MHGEWAWKDYCIDPTNFETVEIWYGDEKIEKEKPSERNKNRDCPGWEPKPDPCALLNSLNEGTRKRAEEIRANRPWWAFWRK